MPRFRWGDLTGATAKVMEAYGTPAPHARTVAEVLVLADARGIPSHGLARLSRYTSGIEKGLMKPAAEPVIVKRDRALALVDGRDGLGQVVGRFSMGLAIQIAREHSMGFVTVRRSNHYGIAGAYSMMALEAGMIGISGTNSAPLVVPTFGRMMTFGTNPISIAVPAGRRRPFVLDMATSVVPRGKLEVYERRSERIPDGWAVDDSGRVCNDPGAVLEAMARRSGGGILPLGGAGEEHGGHKGYGLAVAVEILSGILAGGAFLDTVYADPSCAPAPNVCHFFAAIDPSGLLGHDALGQRMDEMIERLLSSPKAEGARRIWVAGEKEWEKQEESKHLGVHIEEQVDETLRATARKVGVEWPEPLGDS